MTLIAAAVRPFLTRRFVKFGVVGASGVAVNLGSLWLLADGLEMHDNLASALAIELSVLSNFALNDLWTFSDRREEGRGLLARLGRFHAVTGVGAVMQWLVFVVVNYAWFSVVASGAEQQLFAAAHPGALDRWLVGPVLDPPDVGAFKYVAQLIGIGVAMGWNFLANLHWTWKRGPEGQLEP